MCRSVVTGWSHPRRGRRSQRPQTRPRDILLCILSTMTTPMPVSGGATATRRRGSVFNDALASCTRPLNTESRNTCLIAFTIFSDSRSQTFMSGSFLENAMDVRYPELACYETDDEAEDDFFRRYPAYADPIPSSAFNTPICNVPTTQPILLPNLPF